MKADCGGKKGQGVGLRDRTDASAGAAADHVGKHNKKRVCENRAGGLRVPDEGWPEWRAADRQI